MKNINKYFIICLLLLTNSLYAADNNKNSSLENYYFPYITGNILIEYNFSSLNNGNYGNKIERDRRNLSYFEIESGLNFHILNKVSLLNKLVFKPTNKRFTKNVDNDFYGKEKYLRRKFYFNNYDIVFEELNFEYKEDQFLFGLGKFNPTFGTAFDKAKYHGVFDTRIIEDYKLTEKIGFYVSMTLPMFNLRFNSFFNDKSFLSASLFNQRNRNKINRRPGNTNRLNNFSLTSEFAVNDLKFNLGIKRLAVKQYDERAEKGYVLGIEKLINETFNGFGFIPFTEFSYIKNYNGINNRDKFFTTLRFPIYYDGWSIIGTYTTSLDKEKSFKNYRDYLAQITIGYKFENGIMFDISKTIGKESYKDGDPIKIANKMKNSYKTDSWDVRLSYMLNFDGN